MCRQQKRGPLDHSNSKGVSIPNDPLTPETRQRLVANAAAAALAGDSLTHAISVRRALTTRGLLRDEHVLNALEFILLLQFDIGTLVVAFGQTTGSLAGNLYARLLILTIHESTLTLQSLLGPRFREALTARLNRADLDRELREIHSRVTDLHRRVKNHYGDVRDGILAHRDRDAEVRAVLLERTEQEAVAVVVAEVLEVIEIVGPILAEYSDVLRAELEGGAAST